MLRRATYRSRSHAIIAAGVCGVAGIQFAWMAAQSVRADTPGWWTVLYVALAIAAASAAGVLVRKAIRLHREARKPESAPPQRPPDFTTLGNGSDMASRLEHIE